MSTLTEVHTWFQEAERNLAIPSEKSHAHRDFVGAANGINQLISSSNRESIDSVELFETEMDNLVRECIEKGTKPTTAQSWRSRAKRGLAYFRAHPSVSTLKKYPDPVVEGILIPTRRSDGGVNTMESVGSGKATRQSTSGKGAVKIDSQIVDLMGELHRWPDLKARILDLLSHIATEARNPPSER